tara:strand:+ start:1446 stop:1742 length:297 start_codon:yes stop_codon:yes gene_type:complete
MELDFQFFFNAIAGILTFVAGWVFKVVYESIKELRAELEHVKELTDKENDKLWADHNKLALSLPDKYMGKDDFREFAQAINHRFDRLEQKIDNLSRGN